MNKHVYTLKILLGRLENLGNQKGVMTAFIFKVPLWENTRKSDRELRNQTNKREKKERRKPMYKSIEIQAQVVLVKWSEEP